MHKEDKNSSQLKKTINSNGSNYNDKAENFNHNSQQSNINVHSNQHSYANNYPNNLFIITFNFEENSLNIPLDKLNIPCPIIYNQISSLIEKFRDNPQTKKKVILNMLNLIYKRSLLLICQNGLF